MTLTSRTDDPAPGRRAGNDPVTATGALGRPAAGDRAVRARSVRAAVARPVLRHVLGPIPLRVELADGATWGGGGPDGPTAIIHRPAEFFARIGADAKIGFGEAYMAGDWGPAPGTDLADVLTPLADRAAVMMPRPLRRLRRLTERRRPYDEDGSPTQARLNIAHHYDLPGALFTAFLDETLSYSSALFAPDDSDDNLAVAQRRKNDAILDRAGVGADSRLLEIGTGWGQLALQAAGRGAHVTTVTLSDEQRRVAQRRIAAAGLTDRVDVILCDYRAVTGRFDAIVSVEMIEAVGMRYWPTFFATIDRLLAPGGRVGLQSITIAHERLLATRHAHTWIHKYIFPGGIVPSVRAISDTVARHTSLVITDRMDFGPDYARTLRQWREQFLAQWPTLDGRTIAGTTFDTGFRRMWEFYLAYSEAGFRSHYLDVSQFTLHKPRTGSGRQASRPGGIR